MNLLVRSSRTAKLIAGIVAVVILLFGATYLATRTATYESTATMLLVPTTTDEDLPGVLESFTRSATANTYVELIASADTLRRAGSPPVDVTVRAIPESRAITVVASGDEREVQPALQALIDAARARQASLRDVWRLEVLAAPGEPEAAGVPAPFVIIATLILAILGAGIVLVSLRRFAPSGGEAPPIIETRDDRTARRPSPVRSSSERP